MKKLLVTLLVAATSINFVACGSSDKGESSKGEGSVSTGSSATDEKVTLKVQAEKEEVVAADSTEDYQKAADLKTRECQLIDEIDKLRSKTKPKQLTVKDIAAVIENRT